MINSPFYLIRHKLYIFLFVSTLVIRFLFLIFEKGFNLVILNSSILNAINIIIIICSFSFIKRKKYKIYIKYISYIFLIILFVLNCLNFLFIINDERFYFESPAKTNTLIVQEHSVLNSTWIDCYEKKYVIFKKKLSDSSMTTDDAYRPFSNNDFDLKWINENAVIIKYGFSYEANRVYYEKKIEF